jgi:hypothetical protein
LSSCTSGGSSSLPSPTVSWRGQTSKRGRKLDPTYSDANVANRNAKVGHGGDRERSLNERQIPNVRGVRVPVSTGYDPVERNWRASRNGRVSDLPPETPTVTIRNFIIAVGRESRAHERRIDTEATELLTFTVPCTCGSASPSRGSRLYLSCADTHAPGVGGSALLLEAHRHVVQRRSVRPRLPPPLRSSQRSASASAQKAPQRHAHADHRHLHGNRYTD